MVTAVDFHPEVKESFLSSCIDGTIRVWNFSDSGYGKVKRWIETHTNVTSCRFSPDGQMLVAGLANGRIQFYRSDMKLFDTVECKNRNGDDKDGKKVSGLIFQPIIFPDDQSSVDECSSVDSNSCTSSVASKVFGWNLLVTTNDSRLRLISMKNFAPIKKFKDGATIQQHPIKSRFDESGKHVLCASENGRVYFWNVEKALDAKKSPKVEKISARESFKSSDKAVTDAHFVPESCVRSALRSSRCDDNWSDFMNAMIITSDKDGTIRVYLCTDDTSL